MIIGSEERFDVLLVLGHVARDRLVTQLRELDAPTSSAAT